jgi:hypothetical protein
MYTMLAAAKVPEKFNMDYYIAIVTIFPVLMLTTTVLASFAKSIPPGEEGRWSPPFFWIVSFFYNFTPILSAIGTVIGILALMFQWANAGCRWATFGLLVAVIFFVAIASYVYLRAVDVGRQRGGTGQSGAAQGGAAQGSEANGSAWE